MWFVNLFQLIRYIYTFSVLALVLAMIPIRHLLMFILVLKISRGLVSGPNSDKRQNQVSPNLQIEPRSGYIFWQNPLANQPPDHMDVEHGLEAGI